MKAHSRRWFLRSGLLLPGGALFVAPKLAGQSLSSAVYAAALSQPPKVPPSVPFLTSTPSGATRANGGTLRGVGCTFIASVNITVTELGRWVLSGNTQAHNLGLDVFSTAATLASASLTTAGAPVGYKYIPITPVVLTAGVEYVLWSQELEAGGDAWYDYQGFTTHASVAIGEAAYNAAAPGTWNKTGANLCYVPPNMKFY